MVGVDESGGYLSRRQGREPERLDWWPDDGSGTKVRGVVHGVGFDA